jgi:hypothetical protein
VRRWGENVSHMIQNGHRYCVGLPLAGSVLWTQAGRLPSPSIPQLRVLQTDRRHAVTSHLTQPGHKTLTSKPCNLLCFSHNWRAGLTHGTASKEGVRECLNLYQPPECCFVPS